MNFEYVEDETEIIENLPKLGEKSPKINEKSKKKMGPLPTESPKRNEEAQDIDGHESAGWN